MSGEAIAIAATAGGLWAGNTVLADLAIHAWPGAAVYRRDHPTHLCLTFDDGPHPEFTPRILDILDAHGAKGTFFMVAMRAADYLDIVYDLERRGHEIALHGFEHRHLWSVFPGRAGEWVRAGLELLAELLETVPRLFRPPWGKTTLEAHLAARRLGLTTVFWSVCPEGFLRRPTAEQMAERMARRCRGGDIVCLHDNGGFPDTPVRVIQALEQALPRLCDSGLEAVTVSELLATR